MQMFRHATLTLFLLLGIAIPSAQAQMQGAKASPAIADKDKVRADRWIEEHKAKLASLEAFVAEKDPAKILEARVGSITDLRRTMMQPHPLVDFRAHPEFQGCRTRLMTLRTELAKRGLYVGEWREWEFDGQTVGDEEAKFLLSFEDKFNGLRNSNGVSPQGDEKLTKMGDVLKRPEFESNPVLKAYKTDLGQYVLAGAVYRNALLRVKAVGNAFRSVKTDVDKNWAGCKGECVKRVHADAMRVVALVDQVKAAGLNLKDFKVKLDEREPLSEEWDLEKVKLEAGKIAKKK